MYKRQGYDVLKVKDLAMAFDKPLFEHINFEVKKQERVALIGPNGIGKTTLFHIILNDYLPTAGKIKLGSKVMIGYYDQEHTSLSFNKTIFQEISDTYPQMNNTEIRNACASFQFKGDDVFKTIDVLSGGERGRVVLMKLLLSRCNFLILDEPTTGLDPQTRLLIWDIIEKLRVEEKLTVFLTTHYMEEAANAGYVVILDKGSIVAEGTPFELKNEYVQDTMSVYGVTEEEIKTLGREYKKIRDGYQLKVKNTAEATRLIVEHQEIFRDYEVVKGRMDDVFLAVTGKTLGGEHR